MILLADINIIIDYWKPASKDVSDTLDKVFNANDVIIPGIVRAELLHGSRSEKNRKEMHGSLAEFDTLNLEEDDWEVLGDQLYEYRTHGVTVPMPDAIVASIALIYGIPVWSKDGHFDLMRNVIQELQIIRTEELI